MGTVLRYLCLSHSGQLPFYSEFSTVPFRIAQCGKTIHWSSVQASLRSFAWKEGKVLTKKTTVTFLSSFGMCGFQSSTNRLSMRLLTLKGAAVQMIPGFEILLIFLSGTNQKDCTLSCGTLQWPVGCLWIHYFNYSSSLYQVAKHIYVCSGENIKLLLSSVGHSCHYYREYGLVLFCLY